MPQPVLLQRSMPIAIITLLQSVLPALIVALTLPAIARVRDVPVDESMVALAAVSAALCLLLLRPKPADSPDLNFEVSAIGADFLLRWFVFLGFLLALGYATGFSDRFPRNVVLLWVVISPMLVLAVLVALQSMLRTAVLSPDNARSAVIVGFNETSRALADRMGRHPELCTRVQGFFDDRSPERLGGMGRHPMLGRLEDLGDYVRTHRVDVIFVALPVRHIQRVKDIVDELRDSTASLYYVPDLFVFDLIQSRTVGVMGMPVVAMCETPFYGYRGVLKRLTDLGFTLGILVFAVPVMLLIWLLIRLTSRGPAIFRQRRYGLDGREIVVYKFRSMYVTQDGVHVPQARRDDPRITPLGRFLRRYSLDELPQLVNVLQGRMSLVGPRPHAVAHNEQYRRLIKGYMIRHKVRPGITGLAQVNGYRGETLDLADMEARVKFDLDYLRHWSPSLDLKILILTIFRVFRDSKAY